MPFNLSWVDHDQEARDRVNGLLNAMEEPSVRDELGLGQIRDAFADLLFPGTNTIQTRLRYFLIVPWVYRALEKQGFRGAELWKRGRSVEGDVAEHLGVKTAELGVIGKRAGKKLKRLPSSIYWLGLGAWGLRVVPGPAGDQSMWHRSLPASPSGFPRLNSLALEPEEAVFLQERVSHALKGSLLAHLFLRCAQETSGAFVWHHPDYAGFPDRHKATLRHARLFSEAIYGAPLLYNLLLATYAGNDGLMADYERNFRDWSEGLGRSCPALGGASPRAALAEWSLDELWTTVSSRGARVSSTARNFVTSWIGEMRAGALQEGKNGLPAWNSDPATLVRKREKLLKGRRSRFVNPRLLDQWNGGSGDYRMSYRWGTVKKYLADLGAALHDSAPAA